MTHEVAARSGLVFLSHASPEASMAVALKALVAKALGGKVDIFLSSDAESIACGTRWPDKIEYALRRCHVQLVLCSPRSVSRPWISFETGVCWARRISVIPLCHSGLDRGKLQPPLNVLQALNISDREALADMLRTIARLVDGPEPTIELEPFLCTVAKLEKDYTFWDNFDVSLQGCLSAVGQLGIQAFLTGGDTRIALREPQLDRLERAARFLVASGLVTLKRDHSVSDDGSGARLGVHLQFSDRYRTAIVEYLTPKSP